MKVEKYLDSPDLLASIEEKLPSSTKTFWYRFKAEKIRSNQEINLKMFGEWFNLEVDTQYAALTVKDVTKRVNFGTGNVNYNKKATLLTVNSITEPKVNNRKWCAKCRLRTDHYVQDCKEFKSMNVKERRDFAKKAGLCFLCLRIGHTVEKCPKKKELPRCKKCQSYHNELLHIDEVETDEVVNINCTTYSDVLLRIGKIKLKGPNGIINTYAFFDDGSSTSLIDEELALRLGLQGRKSSITYRWTNDIVRIDNDSMLTSM